MDDFSFRRMAVDSAQRYFQYLKDNDKGLAVTEVSSITKMGEEAFLHLRGRLSSVGLETLKLRVYADEYESWEIHPVEYHSEDSILVLRPYRELFDYLPSGKCRDISVVSDLRFLVERVRDWYRNERPAIFLPTKPPDVALPSLSDMAGGTPTGEQYSAVCNVLTTPFSYVWGAPGTGKTRFVLANCVLAYLRQGKQVLLTAPTNNALEQMLTGVLEVFRSCGVPDSRAYRFGIPSAAFAARYPDACEQRSVETRRTALTEELNSLRRQYKSTVLYEKMQSNLSAMTAFIDQLNTISAEFRASTISDKELASARDAAKQAQEALDNLESAIEELTIWLDSFPGKLSRFFRPAVYSEKSALLKTSVRDLEAVTQAHTSATHHLNKLEKKVQIASQRRLERLEDLRKQFVEAFPEPSLSEFSFPSQMPTSAFPVHLQIAYSAVNAAFKKLVPPRDADLTEIRRKISAIKSQLDKLNAGSEGRWVNVKVWAMTIDRFIALSETPPNFTPAHVFMDEAAYCSLIKGYTLLSLNRPVTLLGDHAQLPPVCEMSEHILNRGFCPEFLWAQSAIHLDSVFQKSEVDLYEDYRASAPPNFIELKLNTLSVTHRFGPELSRVLSNFIYDHRLTSAKSEETSIRYIHAPASPSDVKRTSKAECAAIRSLVRELSAGKADFAVLTPYKKQVALLSKSIPTLATTGKIMTIHASQGREFQTIIISVADTTEKFFTDSRFPVGRALLNTAVSRVKSNLIIVLDYDYWHTQKNQLIGQLLYVAVPY